VRAFRCALTRKRMRNTWRVSARAASKNHEAPQMHAGWGGTFAGLGGRVDGLGRRSRARCPYSNFFPGADLWQLASCCTILRFGCGAGGRVNSSNAPNSVSASMAMFRTRWSKNSSRGSGFIQGRNGAHDGCHPIRFDTVTELRLANYLRRVDRPHSSPE